MADTRIAQYSASWHPDQKAGRIRVTSESGQYRDMNFNAEGAGRFLAILQILQGDDDPHYVNGWITTGPESPGSP